MKKLFIIAAIALLVGIIAVMAGMTMVGWDVFALDTAQYTRHEYVLGDDEGEISSLVASLENSRIKILRGDEVKIVYYESDREQTSINFAGGKLTFEQTYEEFDHIFLGFRGLKKAIYYTEIHIPSSLVIDVNVQTKNCRIMAIGAGEFGKLTLKTTNSSIEASGLKVAGAAIFESTNGDIDVEDTHAGSINISTTNNDIELSHSSATSVLLSSTNNEINIKTLSCDTLEVRISNGDIEAKHVTATTSIKLTTTNNGIEVEKIQAPSIRLESTNGKIKGTIVGKKHEYNIDSKTSNSNNNLGDNTSDTEKTLYVRTTNAKIEITFVNS